MTKAPEFTVTHAHDNTFAVEGKRVAGILNARVDITPPRYRDGGEEIDVTVTVPQGHTLDINGVQYSGYVRVAVDRYRHVGRFVASGGYFHRTPYSGGEPTDAARRVMDEAAELIAAEFYTVERLHASRVADAEREVTNLQEEAAALLVKVAAAEAALAQVKANAPVSAK